MIPATIHGTYQGCVVVEDDRGLGEIPVHRLRSMARDAIAWDAARAAYQGRHYSRDLLTAALDALPNLAELPSCAHCVDGPATCQTEKGRDVCPDHMPDDDPGDPL